MNGIKTVRVDTSSYTYHNQDNQSWYSTRELIITTKREKEEHQNEDDKGANSCRE